MTGRTPRKWNIECLMGTTMAMAIAGLLILLVRGTHGSLLVPIVFIVVIILCARYFGAVAGILGSVLGSLLFAVFLFKPYGSVHVNDPQALSNLGLLVFAGTALSYAFSEHSDQAKGNPRELKPRS